jgi:hypothetical protein
MLNRTYRSQIDMFYDADDPREVVHAMHLADLPGVTLHPRHGKSMGDLFRRLILTEPDFWHRLSAMLLPGQALLDV